MTLVPREDLIQPLLHKEHLECFPQTVQQVRRRGIGKEPLAVPVQHIVPAPIASGQFRVAAGRNGLLADGIEAKPRRKHQALLRPSDGHVHPPFVVPKIHSGEGGYGIDHQQRRMLRVIQRRAQRRDIAGHARRCLVVDRHHRPNLMTAISRLRRSARTAASAPRCQSPRSSSASMQSGLPPGPLYGELPVVEGHDLIAGAQRVDERGFPRAC